MNDIERKGQNGHHVIIGTAGHVDHGKTALIKALTGIDTDRLEEEQRRGVTIELGFAYLDFEDGTRAGIIDVPGHERFIRNMLAGAGGIDLAMLVVAADEGVMPQTREHLGILMQLGIRHGLVAVTKLDKVEQDWLELVREDIAQLVEGTFLEGKPLIPVSAHTGEGLQELKRALGKILGAVGEKNLDMPFRLPVDRVFPAQGFGIIVTGTLIEGAVSVGDAADILPSGDKTTVRSIQVHGEAVDTAYAGQRTAINLTGQKRGDLSRGDVVAAKGSLNVTDVFDARLSMLRDSKRKIKSGAELHLYHGARTLLAKVTLLDSEELRGGESCYARFRLREPLPCKRGDRFVVRFYSPIETIGGGVILDSSPKRQRSYKKLAPEALRIREHGSGEDIANHAALEFSAVFSEEELRRRTDLDEKACRTAVEALITNGKLIELLPNSFISSGTMEVLSKKCTRLLEEYHGKHPLRAGVNVAELRQKLLPDADSADAGAVLNMLCDSGVAALSGNIASLPSHVVRMTPRQDKIRGSMLKTLRSVGYDTPSQEELALSFAKNEISDFHKVLENMIAGGELVMLSPQIFWLSDVYQEAMVKLRAYFENHAEITLAECRDLLGTSRKYALALLEYLDGKQITRKSGDARKLV